MTLGFEVVDARAEPHAAVPTLQFRFRAIETSDAPVHAIALRAQLRIEPQRRHYSADEEDRLYEQFGPTPQWGESLRPFLWTNVGVMVPGFTGSTEFDLPVACTYDFEVTAARYLHALGDGEVPLVFLFSGTQFSPGGAGFNAQPVAWDVEAAYRLPVAVWRDLMDLYFPNSGWLRLHRDTLDALMQFRARQAVPTWDQAIEMLLKQADEAP
jgi:Family of unknown function (DUF6084)